jgi:hypothetical protein
LHRRDAYGQRNSRGVEMMHARLSRCTAVFLLGLGGCATAPVTQKVDVPVYVDCVKEVPTRPDYLTTHLTAQSTDGEKLVALAKDWAYSRIYEASLEAVVEGCRP